MKYSYIEVLMQKSIEELYNKLKHRSPQEWRQIKRSVRLQPEDTTKTSDQTEQSNEEPAFNQEKNTNSKGAPVFNLEGNKHGTSPRSSPVVIIPTYFEAL